MTPNFGHKVRFNEVRTIGDTKENATGALGDVQLSWLAKVKVNGMETYADVDSGADVSLISSNFTKRLSDKPELTSETTIRTILDCEGAKVYCTGHINLGIGDKTFRHSVRVGITRDDMILGMDFLRPVGTSFDITNGKLTIGDMQVELTSTELGGPMDVSIVPAS